jgi:hypothetical protein
LIKEKTTGYITEEHAILSNTEAWRYFEQIITGMVMKPMRHGNSSNFINKGFIVLVDRNND